MEEGSISENTSKAECVNDPTSWPHLNRFLRGYSLQAL